MRRSAILAASGIAVALVVATLTGVRAAAPNVRSAQTLNFAAHLRVGAELDLGRDGNSIGDEFIIRGVLHRGALEGPRAGTFEAVCVKTKATASQGECTTIARTGTGQITTEGHSFIPFTNFVAAVTGGTNSYRNARGVLTMKSEPPAVIDLEYHLLT
jgi:hypothetical protein